MEFLDFELEVGKGTGNQYPVEVRSPAGEARTVMDFPFDGLALENRLQALQISLLRSQGSVDPLRRMSSPDEQVVQDFGRTLFERLLAGDARARYLVSRDMAAAQSKGLRLKLRLQPPELAALPWEFLYDPDLGEYVCLSRNTPLVRHLDIPLAIQSLQVTPPLRVLGMIASPKDLAPLDTAREQQRVEDATGDLRERGLLQVTWLQGSTWRDLQRAMGAGPWHIFHFIGHGSFDRGTDEGYIALVDPATGNTDRLTATLLARLLADHQPLRLVLLNSCSGAEASNIDIFASTGATLVRRGIPAVVAMQYEITDRAAAEFAHSFFDAVTQGMPVDAAVAEGRKAVSFALDGTFEWGTPVLYMRTTNSALFRFDPVESGNQTVSTHTIPEVPEKKLQLAAPATPGPQPATGDDKRDDWSTPITESLTRVSKIAEQLKSTAGTLSGAVAAVSGGLAVVVGQDTKLWVGVVAALLAIAAAYWLLRRPALVPTRGAGEVPRRRNAWPWLFVVGTAGMLGITALQTFVPFGPSILQPTTNQEPAGPGAPSIPGTQVHGEGRWQSFSPMSTLRNEVAGAVLDGKIFVAGTEDPNTGGLEEYDPSSDRWRRIDPPADRVGVHFSGMAAAQGKLYLVGGFKGGQAIRTAWEYDAQSGRWRTMPNLQQARGALAVVALGGRVYAIGGITAATDGGQDLATVEIYDPLTDRWTSGRPMPTRRNHMTAVAVEAQQKIYVFGGRQGHFGADLATHIAAVEEYSSDIDTWHPKAALPAARSDIAAAQLDGILYVFGGEAPGASSSPKTTLVNRTDAYDPAQDAWSQRASMPTSRHGYAAVAHDGRIYVLGGGTEAGPLGSRLNEAFIP